MVQDATILEAVCIPTISYFVLKFIENYFDGVRISGRIKENLLKLKIIQENINNPNLEKIIEEL